MSSKPATGKLIGAGLFSVGMVVFALCAHREELVLLRFAALVVACVSLARSVAMVDRPLGLLGFSRIARNRLVYIPLAVAGGAGLGIGYRCLLNQSPLPGQLGWFCILAAGIGICEEIAYRGFVQGSLKGLGLWAACIGGALAHGAYKCSLFVWPDVAVRADFLWLACATVIFGIAFGLSRRLLGSLAFPILLHATFDIVAYGDRATAPWWVGL